MMSNGFLIIDEKAWDGATPEQQSAMTFKTLRSIDARLSKLEKRPVIDKCFSFAGGVVGGAAAFLGIKWSG